MSKAESESDVMMQAKLTTKGSTIATASGSRAPPTKRPNTDMSPNRSMEEFTVMSHQLEGLTEDVKYIRENLRMILKKSEMEQFMQTAIHTAISEVKENIKMTIAMKVEEKTKDLENRIKYLESENLCLKKDITSVKTQLVGQATQIAKGEVRSMEASAKDNYMYNEQYSRKCNIKIMDIKETASETEDDLIKTVSDLCQNQGMTIDKSKILAIHRIPGKSGHAKPVLIKLANNNEKTKIMKNRTAFKNSGHRLADDVTRPNAELIGRLSSHSRIEQAWYYNGGVYGKSTAGKRCRFDLFDRIDDVLNQ